MLVVSDGTWPVPEHLLMLKAGLLTEDTARQAWCCWRKHCGFEHYVEIDHQSAQLLPLVYRNLREDAIEPAWRNKMRGLYRYTWTRSSMLQREFLPLVKSLQKHGIEPLVLGSEALVACDVYPDRGVRPSGQATLLVNVADFPAIGGHLRAHGWVPHYIERARFPTQQIQQWKSPAGLRLDLYGKLLPSPFRVTRLGDVVKHASRKRIQDVELLVPEPTELLLQTCVQGRFTNGIGTAPFLWVADAYHLIQHAGDRINWARLLESAVSRDVLLPVRDSLALLQKEFQVDVPDGWLSKARELTVSGRGIRSYVRCCSEPPIHFSLTRCWLGIRDDFLAAMETTNESPTWPAFLTYLLWRVQHRRLRKTAKAVRRLIRDRRQALRRQADLDPSSVSIVDNQPESWRLDADDPQKAA